MLTLLVGALVWVHTAARRPPAAFGVGRRLASPPRGARRDVRRRRGEHHGDGDLRRRGLGVGRDRRSWCGIAGALLVAALRRIGALLASGSRPPGTTCAPSPSPAPRAGRPAPCSAPGSIARSRTRPTASTRSGAPTRPSGRRASSRRSSGRPHALLHDTVLATLTLLAHSGVGVGPSALRQQAGDDARLLRQLRLGAPPTPGRRPSSPPSPMTTTRLGTTLESVRQRFAPHGPRGQLARRRPGAAAERDARRAARRARRVPRERAAALRA